MQFGTLLPAIFSDCLNLPRLNCIGFTILKIYLYASILAMRLLIITFFLTCFSLQLIASNGCTAQPSGDSITIRKLIADMAHENIFELDIVTDVQSLQIKRGEMLNRQSPYDLLKICMENPNAVVRLYAFRALAAKMDNLPLEAVNKFKNDATPVTIKTANGKKQLPASQIANGFLK